MRILLVALVLASACAQGPAAPRPTPTSAAATTASPAASATSGVDHAVVYLARDRLPPVAHHLSGAGRGATVEERIFSRVDALWAASATAAVEANVARQSKARLATVKAQGDLATLDFTAPGGDWGLSGSAALRGFVQQIVYTASEEPGLRRVLITQNGGRQAVIGGEGLVVDGPRSREDVSGYALKASRDPVASFEGQGAPAAPASQVTSRFSVDEVAPGLARFVVELRRAGNERFMPTFDVGVGSNPDELGDPGGGKWQLQLTVQDGSDGAARERIVDQTPLRRIRTLTQAGKQVSVYQLALDDLRPWRVGVLVDPVRIVLDVGGHPEALATNVVAYAPQPDAAVARTFTLSGMARVFEATVSWRVRDGRNAIIARGTATASLGTSPIFGGYDAGVTLPATASGKHVLEVFWSSPKDGADLDLVKIPIDLR